MFFCCVHATYNLFMHLLMMMGEGVAVHSFTTTTAIHTTMICSNCFMVDMPPSILLLLSLLFASCISNLIDTLLAIIAIIAITYCIYS